MKLFIIKFGILAGLIPSLSIFLPALFVDVSTDMCKSFTVGQIVGYTAMALAGGVAILGMKSYRDKACGGRISYGKAFKVGLYISLITGVIFAIWDLIYITGIYPDFYQDYTGCYIEDLRNSGASEIKIKEEMEMLQFFSSGPLALVINGLTMLITVAGIGAGISLIGARIVRTAEA